MHEIFISYSSKHRELTEQLVRVIEAQHGPGSVWWDHALESRGSYQVQIKAALEKARVVVVIWTQGAMVSDWVYAEAARAQEDRKLVNVRPQDMSFKDIPEPFNVHHIDVAEDHDGILATIAKVMTGVPLPTRVPLHVLYERQHGQRIVERKQTKLPQDLTQVSPSELLQAKYEAIDYLDVTGMSAVMRAWCASGERAVAGKLLHGQGGLGKTRLMIEVAAQLRKEGWLAGFLERTGETDPAVLRQRWQAIEQLLAQGEEKGVLLVLDYAEGRPVEVKKLAALASGPNRAARPVRLVLLARGAGEWWDRLVEEDDATERLFRGAGGQPDALTLPVLAQSQQRLALLEASWRAFAPILQAQGFAPPTSGLPAERLRRIQEDATYERPLALQMEALVWLAGTAGEGTPTVARLLKRVLGMERAHWEKLAGAVFDEARMEAAQRGVAQVTAVQGVPDRASLEALLMADGIHAGQPVSAMDVAPVRRDLERSYGLGAGVGPLEPDLVGEHHVASVADTALVEGCLRWIEDGPEPPRGKRRRDLLTVLQRATLPEHGEATAGRATGLLDHLIREHASALAAGMLAVAVETPGKLVERLEAQVDRLDEQALDALAAALPLQSLLLMDLALRVAQARVAARQGLVEAARTLTGMPEAARDLILSDAAARAGDLGIRLSALGRREEALAASREAVEIHRRPARERPDAFLPDLATSLNNAGAMLSALGRREEALAASREAVEIRRRLAQERPDAFLPDLASSLNNAGTMLSALGRREEALAASREAVEIYRRLAQERPDAFLPDLASSLGALSRVLAEAGKPKEAAAAAAEGLAAIAPLVEQHPEAFGDLGRALGAEVLKHSEAAEIVPDMELLNRVARALGAEESDAEDPAIAALKGKIGAILAAAQATGRLDETALGELPDELADQLRAFWEQQRGD